MRWRWAVGLAIVGLSRAAGAEPAPELPPEIQAIFRDARDLMHQGDYRHAAEKLENARRQSDGNGIKYNLAVCYEALGRTASAWLLFIEVADAEHRAGDDAREKVVRTRLDQVATRVPRVRVTLSVPIEGATVDRDGATLAARDLGMSMPVDPGPHAIVVRAPGRADWLHSFELRDADAIDIVVPDLEHAVVVPPKPPIVITHDAPPSHVWRKGAYVSGGVGLALLGFGGAFVAADIASYTAGNPYCNEQNSCSARGVALRTDALRYGDAATGFAIASGVTLVAATILWLVDPKHGSRALTF